jgi:hypothetical protein
VRGRGCAMGTSARWRSVVAVPVNRCSTGLRPSGRRASHRGWTPAGVPACSRCVVPRMRDDHRFVGSRTATLRGPEGGAACAMETRQPTLPSVARDPHPAFGHLLPLLEAVKKSKADRFAAIRGRLRRRASSAMSQHRLVVATRIRPRLTRKPDHLGFLHSLPREKDLDHRSRLPEEPEEPEEPRGTQRPRLGLS